MRITILFLLIVLQISFAGNFQRSDADEQLKELFRDYDEHNKRSYPEGATYEGDHRFDDQLYDNSESAQIAEYDTTRAFLKRLTGIDYSSLSNDNKLNYDLFKSTLEDNIEDEKFKGYYMPMGQQWGIHINFPQIVFVQPTSTYEEYKKYWNKPCFLYK